MLETISSHLKTIRDCHKPWLTPCYIHTLYYMLHTINALLSINYIQCSYMIKTAITLLHTYMARCTAMPLPLCLSEEESILASTAQQRFSVLSTLESIYLLFLYMCTLSITELRDALSVLQYLCLQVMYIVFICCGENHHLRTSPGSYQSLLCMYPNG